ncbi:MAG TPA: BatD family protein [Ohtaekwangia sp.]|nr:BatD family protein [Ohtaekwangia sp.]
MKWILFLVILMGVSLAQAQEIDVTLGPEEIGVNQGWTIVIKVNNGRIKSYDNFPEIPGLRKRGTSSQSSTSIINGQISSSESLTMNYTPMREGVVTVPSFTLTVNNKPIKVSGKQIKIGPAVKQRSSDPFKNFFDRSPADEFFGDGDTEFVEVQDEALFSVSTNKSDVYVGEGFTTTVSFLISENNRAPLQFYDIEKQLSEILKRIRPSNCWEENFNIENISPERITINGKNYTQYKIHQAVYYPFNTEPITFPRIGLEMIKFKVAKNPSFFGQNRQEDFKTYYSKPRTVTVKELPPHPLRNSVSVGDYKLNERISETQLQTGNSVSYEFNIYGEGNIAGVQNPRVADDENFEIYDPNIRQDINRGNNRVSGTKSFRYFMIPSEPGKYDLKNYFSWIFFNPVKEKYDTLYAGITLNVEGESKKNAAIESNDPGSFYDKISFAENDLRARDENNLPVWLFSGFLVLMVGGSVFLLFRK